MDKAKQWIALTAVGVLAVMAAGWFLLISPKRTEASDVNALTVSQQTTNSTLKSQLTRLKQQAKDLPQQQAKLAAVAAKIPDNPALPSLVRALTDAAERSGVELVSMAPGLPTDVVSLSTATKPAATQRSAATAAANKTAGTATAKKTLASASTATSTAGTLQSIALTLQVAGGFFQIEQFMDELERLSRAFKTTNLTMEQGANPAKPKVEGASQVKDGRALIADIVGNVYLAKDRGVVAAPAVAVK